MTPISDRSPHPLLRRSRARRPLTLLAAGALAAGAVLVSASAASAAVADVSVAGGVLTITTADNTPAIISVAPKAGASSVELITGGAGTTLTPGTGCVTEGASLACTGATSVQATLGDGNDVLTIDSDVTKPGTYDLGGGDDVLTPGSRADIIDGGAGSDTVSYLGRGAGVTAYLDNTDPNGNPATSGINGGAEGDRFTAVEGLIGSNNGDTLYGTPGNDNIRGGNGDDVVDGRAGADSLQGDGNVDTVTYASRSAAVTVQLVDISANPAAPGTSGEAGEGDKVDIDVERVVGTDFDDNLRGDLGNQTLVGGKGNDTLFGGANEDILDGGPGNDNFDGGTGLDEVTYRDRTAPVTATLNTPGGNGEAGENDGIINVEGLTGGSAGDRLFGADRGETLVGLGGDDYIEGRAGGDTISGGDGRDTVSYIDHTTGVTASIDGARNDGSPGENDRLETDIEVLIGSNANDVLIGSSGADYIDGGNGDDVLDGRGGPDRLVGSAGVDRADYASRSRAVRVVLDEAAGDGEAGENDDVRGDVERVSGGRGNDVLIGNDGINRFYGNGGKDKMLGAGGRDTFYGGSGYDFVSYKDHKSRVKASLDNVRNDGSAGELDYIATTVEYILGTPGNDVLRGSKAKNFLSGGAGDDVIIGGPGRDRASGGSGRDRCSAEKKSGC